MMNRPRFDIPKPDTVVERETEMIAAYDRERARNKQLANDLLGFQPFREWAAEWMIRVGFFGYSKELEPFTQGRRAGIVDMFERLAEAADDGAVFMAEVFGKLKQTERKK